MRALSLLMAVWLSSFAPVFSQPIINQAYLQKYPLSVYQLYNRLTVVIPDAGTAKGEPTATLHVKCGSIFEYDSLLGINYTLKTLLDKRFSGLCNAKGIKYSSEAGKEWTRFHFSGNFNAAEFSELLMKAIKNLPLDSGEVSRAKALALEKRAEVLQSNTHRSWNKIITALYRKDAPKLMPEGSPEGIQRINRQYLAEFASRFYVPNNSVLYLQTAESTDQILSSLGNSLPEKWRKADYDPEVITKIIDFKPLIYTVQQIDSVNEGPSIRYYFQGAGIQQNEFYSTCALVLTRLFEQKGSYFQKKLMGEFQADSFKVRFYPGTYASHFEISIYAAKDKLPAASAFLEKEFRYLQIDSAAGFTDFENAKNEILQSFKNLALANPDSVVRLLLSDWNQDANVSGLYFMKADQYVQHLKREEFIRYFIELFNTNNYVGVLYCDHPSDSAYSFFPAVDEGIFDSSITFQNNVFELEGEANMLTLHKICRFLQINEEVQLQVNGFRDEQEFNKAKDPVITAYVDSVPTFQKIKPDLVKKGYFQLDMMRSMKVLYYLATHGIDLQRINGTGMQYRSAGEAEEAQNRVVKFNIQRLKPLQSVRSFGLNTR